MTNDDSRVLCHGDETRAALDALEFSDGDKSCSNQEFDELNVNESVDELDLQIEAYLDDELSSEERAEFENKLANDASLRKRVELEKKTLDALGTLDDEPNVVDITERTVDRLNSETKAKLEELRSKRAAQTRRGRLVQIAAPFACLILGFCVFSAVLPDVSRQRERDADVVERLVQLEAVGDFDYLEALSNANLFEEWRKRPVANLPGAKRAENVVSADIRERPYSELVKDAAFYRLQRRFEALDHDSQEHWRKLRRQIDKSPDKEKLLQTLDDYAGWLLVSTGASDRARLEAMPVDARIQEIRRRMDASQRFVDSMRNRLNNQRSENQERNAGNFAQNTGPGSALRATLPENLRREDFRSIYNKYVEYRSKKNASADDSQGRHDDVMEFLSEVGTDNLVSDFSQESKNELDALDETQRSSMIGLIVSLSFVENAERFVPTRPFQNNEEQQRNPFRRRGASIQELAETLRNANDRARDLITSSPPYEARGRLLGLYWGFFNPQTQNERDDRARGTGMDMQRRPGGGMNMSPGGAPGFGGPINSWQGGPSGRAPGAPGAPNFGGPMNNWPDAPSDKAPGAPGAPNFGGPMNNWPGAPSDKEHGVPGAPNFGGPMNNWPGARSEKAHGAPDAPNFGGPINNWPAGTKSGESSSQGGMPGNLPSAAPFSADNSHSGADDHSDKDQPSNEKESQ